MKTTFIYTLSDISGIRYIGKADKPFDRLKDHLKESKKKRTRKEKWIYSLLQKGELPKLEILDEVSYNDWGFFEKYWISQFKAWNFSIINGTEGGEGSNGFKGKKHSEVTKEKCRKAGLTRKRKISLTGEMNGRSKLTLVQVIEIRSKIHLGISRKIIAEEYKISKASVTYIKNGKRWK